MLKSVFGPEMLRIRESLLMQALSECAGVYFDVDLTRDVILGAPIQVIGGVRYNIHEEVGLPAENCPFTTAIAYWGERLAPEERDAYFDFFSIPHLISCHRAGNDHVSHTFWTHDALGNRMLAEQNILLYEDIKTGDVLGLSYARDLKAMRDLESREADARQALESALDKAQRAAQTKSNFLFNMSHDIRTPMNAVIGYNDIALKSIGDWDKVTNALQKARAASEYMLEILNNVLDMAKIESDSLQIDETVIDVHKLVCSLEDMFALAMAEKGIQFTVQDDTRTPFVLGDSVHITQSVLNLLSNAFKYTPKGGQVLLHVLQTPAPEGFAAIEFHVKDTGIGMSDAFKARVFDSFERERSARTNTIAGAGLGLPIAFRLVSRMGGKLTFTSELGVGSEFVIRLKLKIAPAPDGADAAPKNAAASLCGRRILLVEDNEINREITTESLAQTGVLIEEAEDGEVAVRKVRDAPAGYYDLILMDIQMPVMDGYAAARAIRALEDPKRANVPIVAVTANAFDEDRDRALDAGMDAHIAKPIHVDQLVSCIGRLLK